MGPAARGTGSLKEEEISEVQASSSVSENLPVKGRDLGGGASAKEGQK